MLMKITEILALQKIEAIHSNTFGLQNCSFERHDNLDLKSQEIFLNFESRNGAGAIIASLIITLVLSLTIYGTVSMYCYDPTCHVPCI